MTNRSRLGPDRPFIGATGASCATASSERRTRWPPSGAYTTVFADLDLAPFTKVRGASGEMRVGDRYVIEIWGPWKGAVEVVDVSPCSLRLATLEGHMESGVIEMGTAADASDGDYTHVVFTIESWARSHDRFLDVMYDKLGIA